MLPQILIVREQWFPSAQGAAGCVLLDDAQLADTAPEEEGGLEDMVAEPPCVSTSPSFYGCVCFYFLGKKITIQDFCKAGISVTAQ